MVECFIELGDDGYDWFDGAVRFSALPSIGSRVSVIDKNANRRHMRVRDIIMGGVALWAEKECPLPQRPHITLRAQEEF